MDPNDYINRIAQLPVEKQEELLTLFEELGKSRKTEQAQVARDDFMEFVKLVWPDFIVGQHHKIMARAFERVVNGECKRLIINLAPRHTKSEFASFLLPAWFLGKFPKKKIIQGANTADLATGFGRRVRNLIDEDENYQSVFPGMQLAKDSKAANHWHVHADGVSQAHAGEYFAIGVHGKVTGRGADLFVIDDPHALEINTLIPTPAGFRTILELQPGDQVFGPDGQPTKIVGKSDIHFNRPLYEVVTSDGEVVLCDGGHFWSYRSDTKLSAPYRNATTRDLANWDKSSRPCLPRHAPVEYPARDLPIDPYVLGAWLGDGTSSLGRMTSHPDDADDMRNQFAGFTTTDLKDPFSFGVLGLRKILISENLLNNKHIPEAYLIASVEQRWALLQGLMDTDGTVTKAGQCSFQNTNEVLAQGVRELLHSLGIKARMCVYYDNRGRHKSRKPDFRINFKHENAFRMPRKRARCYTPTDKQHRSMEVTPTGRTGTVQCITVEREDGLFLAGRGYVVTHNSEQEARLAERNPEIYDDVYHWYMSGPRQRLQPGGAIVIVMTRWGKRDLTGRNIKSMIERDGHGDEWEIIELPALLDEGEDNERPIWPEFWDYNELKATRDELPVAKWQAQYQQKPTSEEGAIIKRDWWQEWTESRAPSCEFVIQSWDTAFLKTERADYSACTTWGVFYRDDDKTGKHAPHLILLDAYKARLEFPNLKRMAYQLWKEWEPDAFVIEARASGAPLIFELRAMGIPVQEFTPSRGARGASNDKIARANSVTDIFSSGYVWAPPTRWAQEVIEECASFPSGEHDDYVDSTTQALLRFRQGGFLQLSDDWDDDDDAMLMSRRSGSYY